MSTPDFASGKSRIPFAVWAAGAAIAVVVLAVLVFFVVPGSSTPTATPTTGGSPAPGGVTRSPAPQVSSPAVIPTAAPAGVTWKLVGQLAVPFSSTDGPAKASATGAAGFAHTPVGALIAAAQISTRAGYSAGRDSWEPTLQNQFVASADRDGLLKVLRDAAAAGEHPAGPGELSQIAGFRYLSYSSDAAVIGLVRRTPQGTYAMTTLSVQWQDGDWKLLAPASGQWPSATSALSSMAGVIAWGAS